MISRSGEIGLIMELSWPKGIKNIDGHDLSAVFGVIQ